MNEANGQRRRLLFAALAWTLRLPSQIAVTILGAVASRASLAKSQKPESDIAVPAQKWPSPGDWDELRSQLHGSLRELKSPWQECASHAQSPACARLFHTPQNPYEIGDDPALTQTYGWFGAWMSAPSPYAVVAKDASDVAAAVNFARKHGVRLVVRGGGHSYLGTSNAPDSLLVWTREMKDIGLQDAFVPAGAPGNAQAVRAVSVGAGAMWAHAYDQVTTVHGAYVQGGGCMTVGVAGLVQSGGFGSFSKRYGTAAASLLEAELVTADGAIRIVNAFQDPDLFWALKGGGGGTFGIVTRLTLQVHPLPERFGAVHFNVHASSPESFRRLIGLFVDFCASKLINPNWGEQVRFGASNTMRVSMVFQGLDRSQAKEIWKPFLDRIEESPKEFAPDSSFLSFLSVSAQDFWANTWIKKTFGLIAHDDRPDAPTTNVFWPGDQEQCGQVLYAYESGWLPASLLQDANRARLAEAMFQASQKGGFSLHFNKGLAGAPQDVLDAARRTATNPAVLDAFALVISASEGPPGHDDVPGHQPDAADARENKAWVSATMSTLRSLVPMTGSYVSESDYFLQDWQAAYWGENYARLLEIKKRYDPTNLFHVHHGVGSEA